jgi:hypothetical protein
MVQQRCLDVQQVFRQNAKRKQQQLYVHCYAHCLNLVLVDACTSSIGFGYDFFGVIQYLHTFIEGSCTRHAVFEKIAVSVEVTLNTLNNSQQLDGPVGPKLWLSLETITPQLFLFWKNIKNNSTCRC